jgi:predicted small lipoprotein YifL
MKNKLGILILMGLSLAACGKKGPLTLEPEKLPPAVENFRVKQVGERIEFSWEFPSLAADRAEPFRPSAVTRVHVHHAALKPGESAENFAKKAGLLARVKPGDITGFAGGSPAFRVQLKSRELQGKRYAFSLGYDYGRQRSAPSPVLILNTQNTPPPIQNLQAAREGKMVVLKWSRPGAADKERQPQPILGYQVYRRINAVNGEPDFRPIGAGQTSREVYRDLDTGADGDYEYQVSCRLDERVESAPSNTVSVKVLDTFPPDVPNNLVIFTAKDQIFLTWENVPDPDLAFYRLYRKSSETADFALLADEIKENFFRDKNVSNGKLYIYAVSAVDRKGNESESSLPAQQLFE